MLNRIRRWPARLKRTRWARAVIRRLTLFLFWLLRAFRPVVKLRGHVVVTRYDLVEQVLVHPKAYSVRKFGSRMRETSADFFLGIDCTDEKPERREQRRVEREAALVALDGEAGAARAFEIATEETTEVIRRHTASPGPRPRGGYLDVVEDLGDHVPVRVAERFFGLTNPGQRTLLEWIQLTSWYIFNPFASEADGERARHAGKQTADHVGRLVRTARNDAAARAKRGEPKPDGERTVLDRLIDQGLDDSAVARTLTGLVAGSLGPPPRFFAKAVDGLLSLGWKHRGELNAAAIAGEQAKVGDYLLEAGRLDPDPIMILRAAEQSGTTLMGVPIDTGDPVVCVVASALRDRRRVHSPGRFLLHRPDHERMLFGIRQHWCIGKSVGMGVLTGMAIPLFALRRLERASGKAGRLRDGQPGKFPAQNYPGHLGVCFDRSPG